MTSSHRLYNKKKEKTELFLLQQLVLIVVLLLLALMAVGASERDGQADEQDYVVDNDLSEQLVCYTDEDDSSSIKCAFAMDQDDTVVDLEYCNDDYCITTTVTKQTLPSNNRNDMRQSSSVTSSSSSAEQSTTTTTTTKTVAELIADGHEYTNLGNAYRKHAMVESSSSSVDSDTSFLSDQQAACIETFGKAVDAYTQALRNGAPWDTRIDLAVAESLLAESYLLYYSSSIDPQQQRDKALHYYLSSRDNFQRVLDHDSRHHDFDTAERLDWELYWADVSNHAASLLIQDVDRVELLSTQPMTDMTKIVGSAVEAEDMLNAAIPIYRKAITSSTTRRTTTTTTNTDVIDHRLQLANALHSLGNARMLFSTIGRAITVYEEARDELFKVFDGMSTNSIHRTSAASAMGELLLSLSDAYLQSGNYIHSKIRYRDAMDLYKEYDVAPSSDQSFSLNEDDQVLLRQVQRELDDVHHGDYDPAAVDDEHSSLRYGDLHATRGALEQQQDHAELALTHFVKAVECYEKVGGQDVAIAETKLNMAMALLRIHEYDESADIYNQALETYREAFGDGENPLLMDTRGESRKGGSGDDGDVANAENENVLRAQLLHMEALQQEMANMSLNDEL